MSIRPVSNLRGVQMMTEKVRGVYARSRGYLFGRDTDEYEREFDCWLASVLAGARSEALNERELCAFDIVSAARNWRAVADNAREIFAGQDDIEYQRGLADGYACALEMVLRDRPYDV